VIEPYAFVRAVTIALGATWTVIGTVRMLRFAWSWEQRLEPLGFDRSWSRRQAALVCLRTTVLDPLNLALLCLLAGLWSLRGLD
jgi:hypothetical protein